jgi:hypothetical protein
MRFSRSRWSRPLRWMGEEQFWKDVATRAIAGAMVVGIGYAFGLSAGTIPPPTNKNLLFDVMVVLAATVVCFFLAGGISLLLNPRHRRPRDGIGRDMWKRQSLKHKIAFYIGSSIPWFVFIGGTVGLSFLVLGWLA